MFNPIDLSTHWRMYSTASALYIHCFVVPIKALEISRVLAHGKLLGIVVACFD